MNPPETLAIKETHVSKEWKHTAPLMGCRFDPSGEYVFAASMDQGVHRLCIANGSTARFDGHDSWLRAIGFSQDGALAFTAGYDGRLCGWDSRATQPKPKYRFQAHDGWIRWLAVHPTQDLLATAGNDLTVKLWTASTGEPLQTLKGHDKHVYSLLFHPEGDLLLSGDLSGRVQVWDVKSGESKRTFEVKELHTYHSGQRVDYGGIRCMSISSDLKELACGGLHKGSNPFAGVQEPLVVVLNWEDGEPLRTHEATQIDRGIVWRLQHLEDGTLLGASGGGSGGFLLFWNPTDKPEIHKFKLPNTVLDMDYRPETLDVATAHHDGRIRISRLAAKG